MNKKIVWSVPVALVAVGLAILLIGHLQPSFPATVTGRGSVRYAPPVRSGRTRRSARYSTTLSVSYTDEQGKEKAAMVAFSTIHSNAVPREGDQIRICRGLKGMVIHPSRTLIGIGGGCAGIGGFFLVLFWMVKISLRRKNAMKGSP